ncbi:MAG: hypothetical protein AAF250_16460 [Pseudomonadota bacterium]
MAKILLMEDDAAQAELIAEGLKHGSHEVVIRHEAQSALQALTESRFDLLVSDILVPHAEIGKPNGGVLLIGRVRNSRHSFGDWSLSDIPILAISGGFVASTGVSMERIAKSVGASAYRQKPLSLTALRSAVDMLLSGQVDPEPTLAPPARIGLRPLDAMSRLETSNKA